MWLCQRGSRDQIYPSTGNDQREKKRAEQSKEKLKEKRKGKGKEEEEEKKIIKSLWMLTDS